ncbi:MULTISPECIES: hypothetical protein [Rhizobium]|uniref:Uncharacterized protein n=1 Tax=Rhizobium paranaense TaxID=1650438 RepID=A0A7W9D4H6_9HYPH|nr:hypothetical protein [Rhizobium paranaense]MBB5577383.1 hypothetical protein [Rhizobium paranaense]
MEIFSKRDGPRREDAEIRRLIERNRGVITKLADQISGGRYSESKKPTTAPQPEGLIIHIGGAAPVHAVEPKIRVTTNGRVIAVDVGTGRQLQHFGDIRDRNGMKVFALATKANGFIAPLDDAMTDALSDVNGVLVGPAYGTADLAADIGRRLDIPPET